MPGRTLAAKMKLKPGTRAALVNAPKGYVKELGKLPPGVKVASRLTGNFHWVQVFAHNRAEMVKLVRQAVRALEPESLLWISFPKGSSKVQTDLTRDKGWDDVMKLDLKWVTLISVNDTWSAFAVRPYKPGEQRPPVH